MVRFSGRFYWKGGSIGDFTVSKQNSPLLLHHLSNARRMWKKKVNSPVNFSFKVLLGQTGWLIGLRRQAVSSGL